MSTRTKAAAPVKKVHFSDTVRAVIAEASDKLTRKEIADRLGDVDKTTLGKCLSDQIKRKYIATEVDKLGVPRYYLTGILPEPRVYAPPKKPAAQRAKTGPKPKGDNSKPKSLIRAEERIAKKEEVESKKAPEQYSDIDRVKQELGIKQMDVQYETGYNRGYHDAMFHGHREAYNAGRQSVLKGLLKLLNIKGEVML